MTPHDPVIRSRAEHCISRRDIDPDALKVLYRLARKGHTAYLVGGGVRDLLLGRTPKDFDVSTDASPRQIRSLFRNCFLIGRRFRLAHIKYGDKVIETSTFRALPDHDDDPADPEANLFQKDDNTFGTPEEDALRRDFTINGLFYDIETFSVLDYVGGLKDLDNRMIRCIGDPDIRFREDPVRMIRAIRFASRLGFRIEKATFDMIVQHHEEIEKASPARLFEEYLRLFSFGAGEGSFRLLRRTRLLEPLFPEIQAYLDVIGDDDAPIWNYLAALDRGTGTVPEATPALMFAALYYDLVKRRITETKQDRRAQHDAIRDFLQPIAKRLRFPKRMTDRLVRIVSNQDRMDGPRRRGRRFSKTRFAKHESFAETLALFEIRVAAGDGDGERLEEWQQLANEHASDPHQTKSAEKRNSRRKSRRRKSSRRKRDDRDRDASDSKRVAANASQAPAADSPPPADRNETAAAAKAPATPSAEKKTSGKDQPRKKSPHPAPAKTATKTESPAKTEERHQPATVPPAPSPVQPLPPSIKRPEELPSHWMDEI